MLNAMTYNLIFSSTHREFVVDSSSGSFSGLVIESREKLRKIVARVKESHARILLRLRWVDAQLSALSSRKHNIHPVYRNTFTRLPR